MSSSSAEDIDKRHEELLSKMQKTQQEWSKKTDNDDNNNEEEEEDDTDRLLAQAIELAIQQGKGWTAAEKEDYLKKILDDDFIPPLFATTLEELQKSGLAEAFSSLIYEGEESQPSQLYLEFKKKGNDAFGNGQRNEAKNVQYFRDAVNHYYEALAWACKIQPTTATTITTTTTTDAAAADTADDTAAAAAADDTAVTPTRDGDSKTDDTTAATTTAAAVANHHHHHHHPDEPVYTEAELDEIKSTLCANAALAHMQLRNWGYARDDSKKALSFHKDNIKAWYRLAKSYQMLQLWEDAGDAIDHGLAVDATNRELQQMQTTLATRVQKARKARQQRERIRADRVSKVKLVWKHCQQQHIQLGRVALVATVTDDEDDDHGKGDAQESKWHLHFPHSGQLPTRQDFSTGEWTWPCLFLYPSHNQSDFIQHFGETEKMAMRLAQLFPMLEDDEDGGGGGGTTNVPWDYNNEFVCNRLAVYFEVHGCHNNQSPIKTKEERSSSSSSTTSKTSTPTAIIIHPDEVELLRDQGSAMRFYEASRALKGDEGPEMANVARAVERKHLYQLRKAWIKEHGSLWAKPDPFPIVRVHPAATLRDVLIDPHMVVPNFLVSLIIFPEDHPTHEAYIKEHKCIGIVHPSEWG